MRTRTLAPRLSPRLSVCAVIGLFVIGTFVIGLVAATAIANPPNRRERRQLRNFAPQQNFAPQLNQMVQQQLFGPGREAAPAAAAFDGNLSAAVIQRSVDDATRYLRSRAQDNGAIGEGSYTHAGPTALATLALLATGAHPVGDRVVRRALDWLLAQPDARLDNTYVRGVRANVWEYALRKVPDEPRFIAALKADRDWLVSALGSSGWRYTSQSTDWDNSCTQYGVLGLWAATRAGFDPGPKVWRQMADHFLESQNADGGWGYVEGSGSSANMATAGLASMFLVYDMYYARTPYRAGVPRDVDAKRATAVLAAVERGMSWLGGLEGDKNNSYYLYGIERAAVAGGRRLIGGEDWFEIGARGALQAQTAEGSFQLGYGDVAGTAFTTLFLVYGGAPVAFDKLQYGPDADWNLNPRDIANLTRAMWKAYERPLNWQTVSIDAPLDAFEAPVLFISGRDPIELTTKQIDRLRRYVERGGTILAESADHSPEFESSVRALLRSMYPGRPLAPIAADHPVYTIVDHPWSARPRLLGADDGARTFLFLSQGYMAADWQRDARDGDAFAVAMNILFYATNMRALAGRFSTPRPASRAPARDATLGIARAIYGADGPHPADWNAASETWSRVGPFIRDATGLVVDDLGPVAIADADPKRSLLLHLTGRHALVLSDAERAALRRFVAGGGTILVDAWGGTTAFAKSARREIEAVFGSLRPLAADHPLAEGWFEGGVDLARDVRLGLAARRALRIRGATSRGQQLEIASVDGRIAVIFSAFDLSAALTGVDVFGGLGYTPDGARRIAANLLAWLGRERG